MKPSLAFMLLLLAFSIGAGAQENQPQLLKGPKGWAFERFSLPPSFAPAITYKGFEELRFAPGMFQKEAHDYFTYAFVAQIDTAITIPQEGVSDYLLNYYKGLCAVTAKDRKLVIDTSQVRVTIIRQRPSTAVQNNYSASVHLFGVFADGAPVILNMEITAIKNAARNKTYLFFIASPLAKNDVSWKELYKIRGQSLPLLIQ
ncbi:MAG TPA: hypothetical protein VNT20_04110 [Flavisolibacter sp.]|jgi:hypothetical protein|nr:hypothetical protein [Flavisolibacter sp.]